MLAPLLLTTLLVMGSASVFAHATAGTSTSKPCGPNPGSQLVTRADGSTYPYFGMPCNKPDGSPDTACGDCYLDGACTCASKCCKARAGPPGYVCQANGGPRPRGRCHHAPLEMASVTSTSMASARVRV